MVVAPPMKSNEIITTFSLRKPMDYPEAKSHCTNVQPLLDGTLRAGTENGVVPIVETAGRGRGVSLLPIVCGWCAMSISARATNDRRRYARCEHRVVAGPTQAAHRIACSRIAEQLIEDTGHARDIFSTGLRPPPGLQMRFPSVFWDLHHWLGGDYFSLESGPVAGSSACVGSVASCWDGRMLMPNNDRGHRTRIPIAIDRQYSTNDRTNHQRERQMTSP